MSLDQYQSYIHISRYARWDDEKGRRETWEETVDRYCTFFDKRFNGAYSEYIWSVIKPAIFNLEVMPSMRALMTAGPALERENLAGYNCAYLAVNNKRSFSETLYVLMCGTGVGFSCERQEINKLPELPDKFSASEDTIVVEDSKEGWAKAFRKLISALYEGDIPHIDYSKVRPAGARLKTFGGRASGPEPLKRLFDFTTNVFKKAAGRKLQSIEVHDIMCMIGDVVVVGGVRRSALISLSNLSDLRMRDAKVGNWREIANWRELSNNSAVYTEKPSAIVFLEEWLSLIKSYSGERGIFNREASQKQAARWGRRSPDIAYGCNPCCFTGETLIAVADGRNAVSIKELADYSKGKKKFFVYSARSSTYANQHSTSDSFKGWTAEVKSAIAKKTGEKVVYRVTLSNGDTFNATDDHLLAKKSGGYVMVKDAIGIKLQPFFSFKDKYRTINSFTNGHTRQHKMIWEAHNGPVGKGFEIDHIDSTAGDSIENLQRLSAKRHLAKTSSERKGLGNPVHRQDTVRAKRNISVATTTESNPRWSGLSDAQLVEVGRTCVSRGMDLTIENLRSIEPNFPRSFSKNRFSGLRSVYKAIVLGKTKYKPVKLKAKIAKPSKKEEYAFLADSVKVVSIRKIGKQPIYDLQVEDNENFFIITNTFDDNADNSRGILVHNSEIILRDKQLCNLTEVIIRATDNLDDLKRKVEIATVLGTFQATLTNFKFVSDAWKKNTEEERLLGVSLTGIFDNRLTAGLDGVNVLRSALKEMRDHARAVNAEWADKLDIPASAAITAVKPSGTVSQLCDTASGIHPRWSRFYIRTCRLDKKDPVYRLMRDKGFYLEDAIGKEETTAVGYFPTEAPSFGVTREKLTAIDHLKMWLIYQQDWCEHKPSVTINVKESEWAGVSGWVYDHFDEISGIAFLPYSDHVYEQAPYNEVTEEQYLKWMEEHPTPQVDWRELANYEKEDNTVSSQTLACIGNACEIQGPT